MGKAIKHFLQFSDLSVDELQYLFSRTALIKEKFKRYVPPCQVLADIFTWVEKRGSIKGATVAWIGDGNNMANTWAQAAESLEFSLHISTPPGYEIDPSIAAVSGARLTHFDDPMQAARGADLVCTDVWTSMGFENEDDVRKQAFADWRVDADMMAQAQADAMFMHCLPAH
ncbi:MAG: hypothetical protein EBW39_05385, partial [Betaproteobacteria bacterium]|nr:hypothetical protein [Betaproteobacteria bacterium]